MKFFKSRTSLATTLFTILASHSVQAGGVKTVALSSIPLTRGTITIDGKLNDWPSGEAVVYNPLDPNATFRVETAHSPAMLTLQRTPHTAALRMCYDAQALYAAIKWQGSQNPVPGKAGGAVTLHFAGERPQDLAFAWPGATHLPTSAVSAFQPATNGRGGTQEIRIPWKLLTRNGQPPADQKLSWMADFIWPDLSSSFVKQLPDTVRWHNTALTYSFLTAPAKLFSRDGYIGNTADWGDLVFSDAPRANATEASAVASGASVAYAGMAHQPLTIDGQLSDWPAASFQNAAYAPGFLKGRYSCRLATQWDTNNFYLAAHFVAPGGPFNTQPERTRMGFAGGDALQIRLHDGQHTVNLCGWYDTTTHKPALTADGTDLPNPFLLQQGAHEVFRPDADGQGYVQELAIPWRVLRNGGLAPTAGDTWKATFQPWWAGLQPQFTAYAESSLQPRGALTYAYTIPVESNVSLGLFDSQGHLLRWLVRDEHRRAGRNEESWDGLDQYGQAIPAGSYQIKGLYHPPLGLDYQMTIANPGQPPWPTPDDKGDWLSDEAAPQGAATDGHWVFLAAPGSEKGHSIIAVDEKGQRQWGLHEEYYTRCVSLAVSGNYLYALYSGPQLTQNGGGWNGDKAHPNAEGRAVLLCIDKRTGQPARFTTNTPNMRVATWPYREDVHTLGELRANKSFTPGTYGGQPRYFADDVGESTNALGLAATPSRVYVSLFYEDKLLVLDAATAQKVDEIPLPQPVGLRALSDGNLLAVSGTTVVTVNPTTKQVTPLITTHLVAPHSLTTDARGNIYVSDWATSFQVKVFAPDGHFLRAIGQAGGRPWVGAWQPNGMLVPRGVAVTDAGQLWVAEDDTNPPRISVWNAQSGAFLKDYLGPASYGGGPPFWLDPQDASQGFTLGMQFHLDPAKKTWTPTAQPIRRMSHEQPFASAMNSAVGVAPHRFFTHGGKRYVVINGYQMVIVLRIDGGTGPATIRYTPVAALGGLSRLSTGDGADKTVWDSDIGRHLYHDWYPTFFRGHAGDNFVWTDTNNDGLVEADEMQWVPTINRFAPYEEGHQPEWLMGWGAGIAPDWSIFWAGFNKDKEVAYRVDLQGWTTAGVPRYDLTATQRILINDHPGNINGFYVNDDNKLFATYAYEFDAKSTDSFACYDREGHYLWGVARPTTQGTQDVLGENVAGELRLPGLGSVLGTWLWHANYRPYLLTSDGLYISTLLEESRVGPTAKWDESFKFYYQAPARGATPGASYIINGANDAYHLLKITGLENAKRFAIAYRLSAADVEAAVRLRTAAITAPKPAPQPIIHVAWAQPAPQVDGDLHAWNLNAGVTLQAGQNRGAQIALSRDEKNLYVACSVQGSRFVNGGKNWQTLFISGDAVDLYLATGANAHTAHYQPADGDERLLLSLYQGQPIAVLYRPVVPGTKNATQLMAARIDQIVRLNSAHVAFKRGANSYTLEAAVPVAELGIDAKESGELKGDVGVIFADATGTNRELRLDYYNKHTNITADLTTEATLQPGEWGTLEFPLGPNLLQNGDFEAPLATKREEGWTIGQQKNGGTVHLTTDAPYAGQQSLAFEQTTPVTFSPASYNLPNYDEFIKSANNGQGGGYANVEQAVPIIGGHQYAFRFHYHTSDMASEKKELGAGRGYTALGIWIYWQGAPGAVWVLNEQQNVDVWKTLTDNRANYFGVTKPYAAPAEATGAIVSIGLTANAANHLPKVAVDSVELVDVGE